MPNIRFYSGLFCVTAATLMLQLVQTRILSVVAWYHLAFFVISTAMFGLTAGAVWVYLRGERFSTKTLSYDLTYYSALFSLSTTIALAIQMTLSPLSQPALTTLLVWLELAVCLSVPFFFSGVVVSLALTRSPFPVGRVYGVDLIGAALGCFGVLLLLNFFDGPSAVLWISVLALFGAMLFSGSAIGSAPEPRSKLMVNLERKGIWFVLLIALATLNSFNSERKGLYPIMAKGKVEIGTVPWFERWNSFSRVVAREIVVQPAHIWGPSPTMRRQDWILPQSYLNIDGDAGTAAYGVAGDLERAAFLKYDVTNLAYYLPDRVRAAIIGVGGGRDLLSARVFGVEEAIGIEINPTFVDLHQNNPEFSAFVGLPQIEGVSLVVDEARSWFARSQDSFDLIQMSLIDTWAATGAGAFTLSENGLYTTEAWQIFLRRLTPSGVFTVSRWYSPGDINETGRMVSLAVAALMESGVENPRNHIFLAAAERIATLVISRSGFSAAELSALNKAVKDLKFDVLIAPGQAPASAVLKSITESRDLTELNRFTKNLELDLSPPNDDRPFFFNQLPLFDIGRVIAMAFTGRSLGVSQGNLFATATLAMLFVVALALVVVAIVIPLRPALRDAGTRQASGGTAYFMLIGMGFMFIEMALLQRFSVFLGHPIYSLSIVLFSLILSTGLGSLLSDHVSIERKNNFIVWAVLTGGYVMSQLLWLPDLLLSLDSGSLAVRGLVTVSVILPAGVLMGFGFPAGMRFISAVDSRPTPWFWGINGASGVLASAVAVACSIAYGIGTTMALGALCYFLLIPAAMVIGFPGGARQRNLSRPIAETA